jgi:hypothetical protein
MTRSSRILLRHPLWMAIVLALLGIAVWIWALSGRDGDPPGAEGLSGTTEGRPSKSCPARPTRVDPRKVRKEADAWMERLLASHPGLQIEYRDVPDAENGYLQWVAFIDELGGPEEATFGLPEDIAEMFGHNASFHPDRFREWLAQNKQLMQRITRLGLLPDRSCKGVDPHEMYALPHTLFRDASGLLRMQAHLALEDGDSETAMRSMKAAIGTAGHLDGIEAPTFLTSTVATQIRERTMALAGLHFRRDDRDWISSLNESLESEACSPERLATLVRGEWNTLARHILLPGLLGSGRLNVDGIENEDPELIAEAHARMMDSLCAHAGSVNLPDFIQLTGLPDYPVPAGLSNAGKEIIDRELIHPQFLVAWVLDQARYTQGQAALALSLGEDPPNDPATGKPFMTAPYGGELLPPDEPIWKTTYAPRIQIPKLPD